MYKTHRTEGSVVPVAVRHVSPKRSFEKFFFSSRLSQNLAVRVRVLFLLVCTHVARGARD